jgi:fumarate reductase flavoprotein subunit
MVVVAGIYRSGTSLMQSVEQLKRVRERLGNIAIHDRTRTFNTERVQAVELSFMLDVAQSMLASALLREESRGAHQRTDFPKRDDSRFLVHSLAHRQPDGSCRVEYLPVTITRWPPAERVYGETAPHAGSHHAAGGALPTREGI